MFDHETLTSKRSHYMQEKDLKLSMEQQKKSKEKMVFPAHLP